MKAQAAERQADDVAAMRQEIAALAAQIERLIALIEKSAPAGARSK